jgi:phosphoribosylglycinamide formyltransferase-1
MLKIAVLVSGGGTNLQAIIDSIKNGETQAEIVTVVSNNKNAYALERAGMNSIPTAVIRKKDFSTIDEYNEAMLAHVKESGAELVVLAGFLVVLGQRFVDEYENRIICVHPSLIPSFCGVGMYGLKVHEAVIANGNKVTGATVFLVDGGTDTGKILLQKAVDVMDDDTPQTLQKRVMEQAEWEILPKAIRMFTIHGGII